MKRRDLVRMLEKAGFALVERGGNHDKYRRGNDIESVPRHREVNEITAKSIVKRWGLK